MSEKAISIAHSPDSDDAFMFAPLFNNLIDTEGVNLVEYLHDIETLNRYAFEGRYDISAVSLHAYFFMQDKWEILSCGSSVGSNYGPVLVSLNRKELIPGSVVAIPGQYTTATLVLKLMCKGLKLVSVPFDEISDRVRNKEFEFGLLIHEDQIIYQKLGLTKIADLGEWYYSSTGLPLVLGVVAVQKTFPQKTIVEHLIRKSVRYSLNNFERVIPYAKKYARNLSESELRKFIEMYVNQHTLEMDSILRKSVDQLRILAKNRGLIH
ncbi:MAG: ABC transporter substrate-binding protein [Planctomycetes bacterium]|nr:ABC transporter substrate-binding protein [Planctomycetota bacterium]